MAERDRLAAECATRWRAQNDRLRHLLLRLKRMQFGAKSERLPEEQLQLGLEDLEQAIAQGEAEGEKRDPDLTLRAHDPAPGQPGRAAGASAAGGNDAACRRTRPARAVAAPWR